ncbi:alpha/beta family hydrolase [Microbacterium sp. 2FI]|uniref:alpha/beta hydrolase family protein n=1 Tax=Microbacterium sp. 2FI TaxID=2502193 RepID=UPI0010F53A36|nr:alpha/beta family hydrolase [Microbacterium sp. 2FI]
MSENVHGPEQAVRFEVALPAGPVEVSGVLAEPAVGTSAWAVIGVAHGAGTRFDHPGVVGFARAMAGLGVVSLRFNLPYAEAGRRMPGPAAHAVAGWAAALAALSAHAPGLGVWASGRSYGGRMASMAAAEGAIAPAGLVYLGYPLHPPGKPDQPRVEHLSAIAAPQLFLSGTNDPFVDPHEQLEAAVASCRDAELHWIEGAGHSFDVKGRRRAAAESAAELAGPVVEWMRRPR